MNGQTGVPESRSNRLRSSSRSGPSPVPSGSWPTSEKSSRPAANVDAPPEAGTPNVGSAPRTSCGSPGVDSMSIQP